MEAKKDCMTTPHCLFIYSSPVGKLQRNLCLFSMQDLLDKIRSNTLLDGITVNKSFSESLSDIKINSNNFINDDTD
jgi:hypothetical protein